MSVTTTQDHEGLPFKINLDSLLGQHDMVWSDGLPDDWRLGAPLGNGDIGVVVHGTDNRLSFTLGKTDVWQRIANERDFLPGRNFAELRRTYLDNDKESYDRLVEEFAAGQPQYGGGLPHLTTCGTVHLQGGVRKIRSGAPESARRNARYHNCFMPRGSFCLPRIRGPGRDRHSGGRNRPGKYRLAL